jgi:hypothetical protein
MSFSTRRYTYAGQEVQPGAVAQTKPVKFPTMTVEAVFETIDPDTFVGCVRIGGRVVATSEICKTDTAAWAAADRLVDEAVSRLFRADGEH